MKLSLRNLAGATMPTQFAAAESPDAGTLWHASRAQKRGRVEHVLIDPQLEVAIGGAGSRW
jgi:hypothetical protein